MCASSVLESLRRASRSSPSSEVSMARGKRACWLARETKQGWMLSLEVGKKSYPLRGLRIPTRLQVFRALDELQVVFVER